jgi:hypothetical protein
MAILPSYSSAILAAMVERIFERETDYAAAFRMGIYP